jgi:hypothetical protein
MRDHLGYDLELKAYEWVRMLRCRPWWNDYYDARVALGDRATPALDGFHFLLRGIELPKVWCGIIRGGVGGEAGGFGVGVFFVLGPLQEIWW